MYRNIILIIVFLISFLHLKGQNYSKSEHYKVILKEISGIVKDSSDNAIVGATLILRSLKDTIRLSSNDEGIFVFKNVKSSVFVITVNAIGQGTTSFKYFYNENSVRIVLDPLIIKTAINNLDEVKVNGGSKITYKIDTVEYRAVDYKVRENSTIDALLKKMEGMQVGNDGSLTYLGKQVTRAKLNGRDYFNGDVSLAIKNLPAEIAEKIQIIDDYGDQSARTGIKDGEPKKVLNITTRADKSIGNMIRGSGGIGTKGRYESNVFLQRINANEQMGLTGNFINTINGIANNSELGNAPGFAGGGNPGILNTGGGAGSFGGSGGKSAASSPSISYSNQWNNKIKVNGSYSFIDRNVNSVDKSSGRQFSSIGTTVFSNESNGISTNKSHNLNFNIEYDIDSANFLKINPSLVYSSSKNTTSIQRIQSGIINQNINGTMNSNATNPNEEIKVLYQHIFKKPKRIFSILSSYSKSEQDQTNLQNNNILYYDTSDLVLLDDSLVVRRIDRNNVSKNIKTNIAYIEPLNTVSQLEFITQVNFRGYNNKSSTANLMKDGYILNIDSLNSIYNYSYTETQLSFRYKFNKLKFNFSLGFAGLSSSLKGTQVSLHNTINRRNFNFIPVARFEYIWSRQERISLNYSGAVSEPSFNQIQSVRDVSNPINPIVGNPNLKPSFWHNLNLQYNNYVSNSELNISANISGTLVQNLVTENNILIPDVNNSLKNEIHYLNLNGYYLLNGYYNISKFLDEGKYTVSLVGVASYGRSVLMSNNIRNYSNTFRLNQRFGPKLNPTAWLELNPYVSFDYLVSENTIPGSDINSTSTFALSLENKIYFSKDYQFSYSANKNFVRGINSNITNNPFVLNMSIERAFFKERNFSISIQAIDIFNQNNFINRDVTQNEVIDTKTNTLSRYFMFNLIFNLQKWSKMPLKNGRPRQRKGDGSFLN